MKVKIFYICNDTKQLEQLINDWILEVNPIIKIVTQCSSVRLDHHVTTTIFGKANEKLVPVNELDHHVTTTIFYEDGQ